MRVESAQLILSIAFQETFWVPARNESTLSGAPHSLASTYDILPLKHNDK